jgi:hypothetical protein
MEGKHYECMKISTGKTEGKKPFVRPRHRWEDNIKMDLIEIGWKSVDWIQLAQKRHKGLFSMELVSS